MPKDATGSAIRETAKISDSKTENNFTIATKVDLSNFALTPATPS
jgi:hypothetical protein